MDRLGQAFARLQRRSEQNLGQSLEQGSVDEPGDLAPTLDLHQKGIAILFLDLDDLKRVNDSLGHEAGDGLLVEVAARIGDRLRPTDTLARLAGDEFVVLLEEVDEEEAIRAAERIIQGFDNPFTLSGQEIFVSASLGIALDGGVLSLPNNQRKTKPTFYYGRRTSRCTRPKSLGRPAMLFMRSKWARRPAYASGWRGTSGARW